MIFFNELRQIGCCLRSLESIIEWFLDKGVYGIIDKHWDEYSQYYHGFEITIYIDKKMKIQKLFIFKNITKNTKKLKKPLYSS